MLMVIARLCADGCELARLCVERVALIFPGKEDTENATSKEILSPCSMRVYEVDPDSNHEIFACSLCLDCVLSFGAFDIPDSSS